MQLVLLGLAIAAILGVLVAGTIGLVRFFTESSQQRMARLADDARNRDTSIGDPNDPQGLGSMIGDKNDLIRFKPSGGDSGADSSTDSGSCGDGGSGE